MNKNIESKLNELETRALSIECDRLRRWEKTLDSRIAAARKQGDGTKAAVLFLEKLMRQIFKARR